MIELIITFLKEYWELLFGASGLVSFVLYYKQTKRTKNAEATIKEIGALKNTIDLLEQRIESLHKEVGILQQRIDSKDGVLDAMQKRYSELEKKYNMKKSAISCALSCTGTSANECPVLKRQTELDDKYLKQ